jgi:succinate dehydrogenase / fumarate reductase iron-sulfur subunit
VTKTINLTLKIWRQSGPESKGRLDTYQATDISTDMSFLEMLDVINDKLTLEGKDPIAFDHDCPWTGERHNPVPAAYASFLRW